LRQSERPQKIYEDALSSATAASAWKSAISRRDVTAYPRIKNASRQLADIVQIKIARPRKRGFGAKSRLKSWLWGSAREQARRNVCLLAAVACKPAEARRAT
jgi:hypothetical protein